jgi:RNA polymerase sigma-70 factor (ECF subfamily)
MRGSSDGPSKVEITQLLKARGSGDDKAVGQLTPVVEGELDWLADHCMTREKPGHSLQPATLVNVVYFRLVDISAVDWQDRARFFAISARMMRRTLTDFARSRSYQKRGDGAAHVLLDEALLVTPKKDVEITVLDEDLAEFTVLSPRQRQVVKRRFFGGFKVNEAAEALKISPETVKRDWRFAKTWLLCAMSGEALSTEKTPANSGEQNDGC